MWRIVKDISLSRNLTSHTNFPLLLRTSFSQVFPSFLGTPQNAALDPELCRLPGIRQLGSAGNSSSSIKEHGFSREYQVKSVRLNLVKGFGSAAAEVAASSTDEDVPPMEEIEGGVMRDFKKHDDAGKRKKKEEEKFAAATNNNKLNFGDMSYPKYYALKRRQAKIETEAWDNAAKEYRELILDMCDKKLAPNLPYVKSLLLGWFEPLKTAIAAEQKAWRQGKKQKITYGPYIDQLPADKMAIITMHKLMALLMSGVGNGSVRIIQASLQIGEAVENETRVHRFMESTQKNGKKGDEDFEEETDTTSKES